MLALSLHVPCMFLRAPVIVCSRAGVRVWRVWRVWLVRRGVLGRHPLEHQVAQEAPGQLATHYAPDGLHTLMVSAVVPGTFTSV
jgi:hypothetical protein